MKQKKLWLISLAFLMVLSAGCTDKKTVHADETEPVSEEPVIPEEPETIPAAEASYVLSEGMVTFLLPDIFDAKIEGERIVLSYKESPETVLHIFFDELFGVCGTGLVSRNKPVNGIDTFQGYYEDGQYGYSSDDSWEFAVMHMENLPDLVLLKMGEKWGDEELVKAADIVLNSVKAE
jgi:hypothetical protein